MDNSLLWFFAIPVAIVILSVVIETIIHSPIKIAGITFSILLIVTFAINDLTLLIYTILYKLLSFIVAWITRQILCQTRTNNNQVAETARNSAIEELIKQSSLNNTYINGENDYSGRYRRR